MEDLVELSRRHVGKSTSTDLLICDSTVQVKRRQSALSEKHTFVGVAEQVLIFGKHLTLGPSIFLVILQGLCRLFREGCTASIRIGVDLSKLFNKCLLHY